MAVASDFGNSKSCDPKRQRRLEVFLARHAHALARQGAVQCFYRTRGSARCGPYYRIIVRAAAGQRTFYLGRDRTFAESVRGKLNQLQGARREYLERQRRIRACRAWLRGMRAHIRAQLADRGLRLKGWELRGLRALRAQQAMVVR